METKIKAIRAYVVEGGGADYHDQTEEHWIVNQISTPMSIYPEYKKTRTSFGINALKTLVVEVEADNGVIGFGISTGGYPAAWLVMNAISAIDLALWDLLGKLRNEPVYKLLGGKVRDELQFYATGPRPDLAKEMGFIGGKIPLVYGPADGEEGLRKNIEFAKEMREKVGPEFMLMWDCWMSLDLPYAKKLMEESAKLGFKWIEECFNPDDY